MSTQSRRLPNGERGFLIPMRGNELQDAYHGRDDLRQFLIPMRGNEICDHVKRAEGLLRGF